ncbi:MAG: RNase adapter RapZ [Leptospirales bacterium]
MGFSFLFVTGLSGAGKSQSLRVLEDLGYFCVDNLPIPLVPAFAALSRDREGELSRLAIGVDIRERGFLREFREGFARLKAEGHSVEVLFLEAADDILMRRFSETRRPHPLSLSAGLPLTEAIREERARLSTLKKTADRVVDTGRLSTAELRIVLGKAYGSHEPEEGLRIYLLSFGFKFGLPLDADLVFDVRFLPNPNYEEDLAPRTGLDGRIWEFLLARGAEEALSEFAGFLKRLLPRYAAERRSTLTIAIGCTGGRHRSVAMATHLGEIVAREGYTLRVAHRDIEKEESRYKKTQPPLTRRVPPEEGEGNPGGPGKGL